MNTTVRPGWIPDQEIYCAKCCRLVAAVRQQNGALVPAGHFVFWSGYGEFGQRFNSDSLPCKGWYGFPGMTSGMEDPKAAFSTEGDGFVRADEFVAADALGVR